jgi:SAM-dependent methyltransferase
MNQAKIWAYFQNEGASSFEAALPRYRYLLMALRKYVRLPATVLNIGVGSGKMETLLLETGYRVSALDPDADAISKLAGRGVDARAGVAERLPFEGGSFDAVIASEVLEHLDEGQCAQAVGEILRVLKPGGYLLGTVPYQENLTDNLTVCPHCGERFHRWGHRQTFNKAHLVALLANGFELVNLSRRAFVVWSVTPMRLLKSGVKWLLGRMGEQIASPRFFFECRKL